MDVLPPRCPSGKRPFGPHFQRLQHRHPVSERWPPPPGNGSKRLKANVTGRIAADTGRYTAIQYCNALASHSRFA